MRFEWAHQEGGTWWLLEYLKQVNLSEGIPGYGSWTPLLIVLLFYFTNNMIVWMHDHCCLCKILVSGKFPETAWRALYSHQAAHTCVSVFLGSWRNRLVVKPCTARWRKPVTCFWVFCRTPWRWWVSTRRCEPVELDFLCFSVFWRELIEELEEEWCLGTTIQLDCQCNSAKCMV